MENQQNASKLLRPILLTSSIVLILILCAMVAIPLYRNHMQAMEDQEASILAHAAEHNQTVTDFPHAMTISGKTAYLESIDIFELKTDHEYVGYLIVTIDRGELTDDDMHWILKGYRYEWELDAYASWYPDGLDSETLYFLACRYTDSHIYFFFHTDGQRNSLHGSSFYASITYLESGADYSDKYLYSYLVDFAGEHYHDSIAHLPEKTRDLLVSALEDANS
jgi:hypothetical protein